MLARHRRRSLRRGCVADASLRAGCILLDRRLRLRRGARRPSIRPRARRRSSGGASGPAASENSPAVDRMVSEERRSKLDDSSAATRTGPYPRAALQGESLGSATLVAILYEARQLRGSLTVSAHVPVSPSRENSAFSMRPGSTRSASHSRTLPADGASTSHVYRASRPHGVTIGLGRERPSARSLSKSWDWSANAASIGPVARSMEAE